MITGEVSPIEIRALIARYLELSTGQPITPAHLILSMKQPHNRDFVPVRDWELKVTFTFSSPTQSTDHNTTLAASRQLPESTLYTQPAYMQSLGDED